MSSITELTTSATHQRVGTALAKLVSGYGQYHSENHVSNPKPYETVSYDTITRMAKTPTSVPKESAQWCIPSTLITRVGKDQQANGQYNLVWLDFDHHTEWQPLASFLAELSCSFTAYSSRSATPDCQKWRVVIPLLTPLDYQNWHDLTVVINSIATTHGLIPDTKNQVANQVFYLPNHGEFYQQVVHDEAPPLVFEDYYIKVIGVRLLRDKEKAEQQARSEASRVKTANRLANGTTSVIDAINECYDVEDLLYQFGYLPVGKRWLSPNSESGNAGVTVMDNRWFSSHDSDSGIGKPCNGGVSGDCFDLVVHYEFSGDHNAALRSLGNDLTTTNGLTINKQNQVEFMRQQTNVTELFGPVSQPAPDLPTRRKLNITTLGQLARDAKAPEFMINNILETQSHGMMIGDSESFKSFLLLHLASCITTSKPFLGNNVYTTGKVLYICGEGKGGIGRRGRGIAGQTENDNILVVDEYITMKSETALAGIADIVREHDIKLVMIDTYSSLSGSDDEQSNSEVANILQQVRTACGNASSIVSHHFGKDKSKGARGASAFRANADFVWMVERDKDHPFEGRIICDKMKDADHFKDQFFIAKQVPLFGLIRQDETMATTLVIEEFMPSEKEPEEFDHYTHSLITTKESLKQELKLNDAAMENLLTNHYLQAFLTIIGDKKDYTSVLADVRSRTNTKAPPTPNLSEESRRKAINRLILKFIDFGLLVYSKDLKSIIITHKGETVIGLINELWRLENDDVFSRTFLFDESHTDTSSGTPYHSPIPHNSVDLPDWITG